MKSLAKVTGPEKPLLLPAILMVVVLPAPVVSLLPNASPADPVIGAVTMRVRLASLLKSFPGATTEMRRR